MPTNIVSQRQDALLTVQPRLGDDYASPRLCCCAYVNKDKQPSHLLACLCDCGSIDLACTQLVTCQHISRHTCRDMLLTFQDRLRIPWPGGARRLPAALLPGIIVPFVLAISALNSYTACIMTLFALAYVACLLYVVRRLRSRTNMLFAHNCWSAFYMLAFFQYTVPLLELLPEENVLLLIFSIGTGACCYLTRRNAPGSAASNNSNNSRHATNVADHDGDESHTALLLEHEDASPHGQQQSSCTPCGGVYVAQRIRHSYWLDCCIVGANHRLYVAALVLGLITLLFGSNLLLTAVCHPYLFVRVLGVPVMLPDDCSEVFDDYEMSLAFMVSGLALLIAAYIIVVLGKQLWLISMGEFKQTKGYNRKSVWSNWKAFLLGP